MFVKVQGNEEGITRERGGVVGVKWEQKNLRWGEGVAC